MVTALIKLASIPIWIWAVWRWYRLGKLRGATQAWTDANELLDGLEATRAEVANHRVIFASAAPVDVINMSDLDAAPITYEGDDR